MYYQRKKIQRPKKNSLARSCFTLSIYIVSDSNINVV